MTKTIVVLSDELGKGESELGHMLMKSYLYALARTDEAPDKIIFMNSGAYLTSQTSESLEDLRLLEQKGTKIYTCGTCMNYYDITEKLAVGQPGNMADTAQAMMDADNTIVLG